MPEDILDNDIISRSIIDPKDFDEKGVLCLRKSFQFSHKNHYTQSVNCNRLLNNDVTAIHNLGLRKEALDHQRGYANRKYVGYVEARTETVRGISVNNHQAYFEVYHHEENGNNAHCHIKLHFKEKNEFNVAVNKLLDTFSELIPLGATATT